MHIIFVFMLYYINRCSAAFFLEERNVLEQRRQKVRLIQQRKLSELTESEMKDLPDQIPLPLVIGTEVTGERRKYLCRIDWGTAKQFRTTVVIYAILYVMRVLYHKILLIRNTDWICCGWEIIASLVSNFSTMSACRADLLVVCNLWIR